MSASNLARSRSGVTLSWWGRPRPPCGWARSRLRASGPHRPRTGPAARASNRASDLAERDPAREVALAALRAVRERGAYANLVLPALLAERGITGRDAALATELTYGTART